MKVKKYPQSHLVISSEKGKLIIDPGFFTFDKGYKVEDFADVDAYLITHRHDDHLGPDTIKELVGDKPVYGNADVVAKLKTLGVEATEVKSREKFSVLGYEIEPVDLPHFKVPDNRESPQNTGFIVDGVFFHAGDGFKLDGVSVNNTALALGHSSLSILDVLDFAKSLNAKVLIPIHYDAYKRDPEELVKASENYGYNIEIRPLADEEETEIS